jgi:hypothetical protein
VIFCHVIGNALDAHTDLCILDEFVGALGLLKHLSEDLLKVHRLCESFLKICHIYVRFKVQEDLQAVLQGRGRGISQPTADPTRSMADEIDEYTSNIDVMPRTTDNFLGSWMSDDGSHETNCLDNWFHPYTSLMDLLEYDLRRNPSK